MLRKEDISPSLRVERGGLGFLPPPQNSAVLRLLGVGIDGKKKILPSTILGSEEAHSKG